MSLALLLLASGLGCSKAVPWEPEAAGRDSADTGPWGGAGDADADSDSDSDTDSDTDLVPDSLFAGVLALNELVALPSSGEDWIELYNTSGSTLDLSGWMLTDTYGEGASLLDEGVTVGPRAWLVLYATGEGDAASEVGFKLSSHGETVVLLDRDGLVVDAVSYPPLEEDEGYAREADGVGSWAVTTSPTQGSANGG